MGSLLDPNVQATVLAKYSRSPESAKELLKELSLDNAQKFQEKWVVNYGHNSVAELASIPICLEGISIIASKFVERWQRAGYSEKSTRYQRFSIDSFIIPPGAPPEIKEIVSPLYETYQRLYPLVWRECAIKMNKDPDDPLSQTDKTINARTFDNIRYLLPAGTGTNVACVMNIRDLRDLIISLKSHTNSEFNQLGKQITEAASALVPSLLKHMEPSFFRQEIKNLGMLSDSFEVNQPYVGFYRPLHENIEQEIASFIAKISDWYYLDFDSFDNFMKTRSEYEEVPDLFKSIKMSLEIIMDYGAFRDLQRHRRCEQYVEPLSTHYGYIIPDDLIGTNLEEDYVETMDYIKNNEHEIVYQSDYNQYIIPLGFLHRSVFQLDLKELYYIVELRTKPQGHISYRRIAYEMFKLAHAKYNPLTKWCRVIQPEVIGIHK
jgi:thymidylate synthase ThyX